MKGDPYLSFSVLMSVYCKDSPAFLAEALESILRQTVPCQELVLVMDGDLTPELDEVIGRYRQSFSGKLLTYQLPSNQGLGAALNHGLAQCKCEYVVRMDADDIAIPERLEVLNQVLRADPALDLVGSFVEEFEQVPGDLGRVRRVPVDQKMIIKRSRTRNPFNHMSVTFRKKAIEDLGSYQPFYLLEDYYLWYRALSAGCRCANIPESTVYARVGNGMIGRRRGWKYYRSEVQLFSMMLRARWISFPVFVFNLLVRGTVRLIPLGAAIGFYKYVLRRSRPVS